MYDFSGIIIISIFVIVFSGVFWGIISGHIYKDKNGDPTAGFFLGFFLGFIGLVIALCLKSNQLETGVLIQQKDIENGEKVKFCEKCGYQLFDDDTECPNCHTKRNIK